MDISGKVALVTGAARRVGRAVAIELARSGCDVAIHCHKSIQDADGLRTAIQTLGRRAAVLKGDLADPAIPDRLVADTVSILGRLDILVNNASIFDKIPLEEAEADRWERMLRINTVAPALLIRAAAPIMRSAGAGRIVNLTDILADRPIKHHGPYCASKAALACLTRSLALELAPLITVNAIAPGIAVFPEYYDPDLRERLTARVPLKRSGSPEEIAALVRFLATEGDYITGQIIPLDGGASLAWSRQNESKPGGFSPPCRQHDISIDDPA